MERLGSRTSGFRVLGLKVFGLRVSGLCQLGRQHRNRILVPVLLPGSLAVIAKSIHADPGLKQSDIRESSAEDLRVEG